MPRTLTACGWLISVIGATACSAQKPAVTPSFPAEQIVQDMKAFETTVGMSATNNFRRYADNPKAIYRCYFTGKLELPDSYRGLRLGPGTETGCALNEQKYDIFFYRAEAVASGTIALTPALADAPLERLLVIVPHEDFHNQAETREVSPEISEAAATLIGFLTASEFAKGKYGATSQKFRRLSAEARLFREKATLVNRYSDNMSALYAAYRSHQISRGAALIKKQEFFRSLEQECHAIMPRPVSFDECPSTMNNAALAFDRTYTREYPIMFDLHLLLREDARATTAGLRRLLTAWPKSASRAEDLLHALDALAP